MGGISEIEERWTRESLRGLGLNTAQRDILWLIRRIRSMEAALSSLNRERVYLEPSGERAIRYRESVEGEKTPYQI